MRAVSRITCISMPSKCACPRGSGPLLRSKDCPKLFLLSIMKSPVLSGKKPAEAINEKAVYSKPASKYTRPVGHNENSSPLSFTFGIRTNQASWKGGVNVLLIPSGL